MAHITQLGYPPLLDTDPCISCLLARLRGFEHVSIEWGTRIVALS